MLSNAEFVRTYRAANPRSAGYTAANKALAEEGYTLVPEDAFDLARQVARMLHSDTLLGPIIQAGETHKVVQWTETRFGHPVQMKAEFDAFFMHQGRASIIDLKGTKDAAAADFPKGMAAYQWLYQAACYCDVAMTQLGAESVSFYWVAVDTSRTPAYYVYEPDPAELAEALTLVHSDMAAVANAFLTGEWLPKVRTAYLPHWYKANNPL